MHKNQNDVHFWTKWQEANPQKIPDVRKAKELYNILNGNLDLQVKEDQKIFKTLFQQHLSTNSSNRKVKEIVKTSSVYKSVYILIGVAAAIVGAFFIFPWSSENQGSNQNLPTLYSQVSQPGEKKFFQLPDGSQITLNSGSSIRVVKGFNNDRREILLEGEAYFEITHNPKKPFIIHTKMMDIKVLGTVFNVKAYPADPESETSLISGSVEITLKDRNNKKVILRPHEKITLSAEMDDPSAGNSVTHSDAKKLEKAPGVNISRLDSTVIETPWMRNQLLFANQSFERIAVELERNYNVRFEFEDNEIRNYRYTATFEKKTITQILEALKLSRSFDYKIMDGKTIVVK